MIRLIFLAITVATTLTFTASAQTLDPYLDELLRQSDELIQESRCILNSRSLPANRSPTKERAKSQHDREEETCQEYNQNSHSKQRGNVDELNPTQNTRY